MCCCMLDMVSCDDDIVRPQRPLSRTKSAADTSYCTLRKSLTAVSVYLFTAGYQLTRLSAFTHMFACYFSLYLAGVIVNWCFGLDELQTITNISYLLTQSLDVCLLCVCSYKQMLFCVLQLWRNNK